jgi:hypothetical protein
MNESIQLTEEEISSVTELREQVVTVISNVGQLKLTMDLLKEETKELENKLIEQTSTYKSLLEKEKSLINGLLEKYGVGSLDIDTGVFTPEK